MAAQHREVLLGRGQLVHGDRHQVVGELVVCVLVEVVADARAVCQQVLDRHPVVDERQILAEHRPRRRRELERAVLDQAHDRERRQALRAARDRELRVDGVRDLVATVARPYAFASSIARAVDTHDAGERRPAASESISVSRPGTRGKLPARPEFREAMRDYRERCAAPYRPGSSSRARALDNGSSGPRRSWLHRARSARRHDRVGPPSRVSRSATVPRSRTSRVREHRHEDRG